MRGDAPERVIDVRQMVDGDVANKSAFDGSITQPPMQPAQEDAKLREQRKGNDQPIGIHRRIFDWARTVVTSASHVLQAVMERASVRGMRYALIAVLALCAFAAEAIPQAAPKRKISCKTPENAASCYWTHGRLSIYSGNPSLRLWKIGTNRILGIYSGPNSERYDLLDNEHPELPGDLDRAYQAEYKRRLALKDPDAGLPEPVFGDFEVCPLEPQRKGEMQAVCIESAKNIFIQKLSPRHR